MTMEKAIIVYLEVADGQPVKVMLDTKTLHCSVIIERYVNSHITVLNSTWFENTCL